MDNELKTAEPGIDKKHMVDVFIPPECLDSGPCPHDKIPVKQETNPI